MSTSNGTAFRIRMLASFLRLPLFGWSLALPVLGILTASGSVPARAAFAVAMALPFQIVLGVVNDLADMELDRGDPRKAGRPLVSGLIRPSTAIRLVVGAVVVAIACDPIALGLSLERSALLVVALAATAVYNVYGKRTPIPPVMDLFQGIGAGAFAAYGAAAAGHPTGRTLLVALSVVVFILFINGVHAGLRDLTSDFAHGARTTPIALGARPTASGSPYIPRRLILYAWSLQCVLAILAGSQFAATCWPAGLRSSRPRCS